MHDEEGLVGRSAQALLVARTRAEEPAAPRDVMRAVAPATRTHDVREVGRGRQSWIRGKGRAASSS